MRAAARQNVIGQDDCNDALSSTGSGLSLQNELHKGARVMEQKYQGLFLVYTCKNSGPSKLLRRAGGPSTFVWLLQYMFMYQELVSFPELAVNQPIRSGTGKMRWQ